MIIFIYSPAQYNRNIRQMRVPFRYNERNCAGNYEAIRKKFMCTSAVRVRSCRASINARAIKIKREAFLFLLTTSTPLQILCKTHEPNRPLIERSALGKRKSCNYSRTGIRIGQPRTGKEKNPRGLREKKKGKRED